MHDIRALPLPARAPFDKLRVSGLWLAGPVEMTQTAAKKSDLGVRTLSAIVMLAVAGGALWAGGWWWTAFVTLIALGVLWEWSRLVDGFAASSAARAIWLVAGLLYVGFPTFVLDQLRRDDIVTVLVPLAAVILVDISAYFGGRTIGGPKIAPAISPSKTWAGLISAMIAAGMAVALPFYWFAEGMDHSAADSTDHFLEALPAFAMGAGTAVVAQLGDFFESWMKRRAGVKDSGRLLPGHGGLFDRVDGLLPVLLVIGVVWGMEI